MNYAYIFLALGKTTKAQGTHSSSGDDELHRVAKKLGRGKRLSSQSKYIIESVKQFFEKEKSGGMSLKKSRVADRTAAATGVSVKTVYNIHREFMS